MITQKPELGIVDLRFISCLASMELTFAGRFSGFLIFVPGVLAASFSLPFREEYSCLGFQACLWPIALRPLSEVPRSPSLMFYWEKLAH